MEKKKKKFYKRWWFWAIIAVVVIGMFGLGDSDEMDPQGSEKAAVEETHETDATTGETTEHKKTEEESVSEMGQYWFQSIDWDGVFKYKADVHYIMGYSCQKVTSDEIKKYGKYVATSSADLQNGFGAEFSSTIYIFMNKKGVIKHVFYDEADGNSIEIPLDSIPMLQ